MTTYAIYGFVLAFLVGLIALVVKLSKGSGYKEAELERAENEEAVREIISERLKQIETRRANTSADQRLRERQYRD